MPGAYLWIWDTANSKWVKLAGTAAGAMSIHAIVDELGDIGDVNVAAPTDGYVLYWDATAGKFQLKAISTSKIVDADGDTSIDVEQAADEDILRGKVAGVEAFHISAVGIQTLAKQSGVRAYRSANQNIPTGTYAAVQFDGETFDIQNEFDSSRKTGTASATSASHLIDTTLNPFVAGDVGKTVWNTTDNTYTTITLYNSASDVTLDDDIMASGEGYNVYAGRFTAKEAGVYFVDVKFEFEANATGRRIAAIRKNGAWVQVSAGFFDNSDTFRGYVFMAMLIVLAANDYLSFDAYQDSGGTIHVFGSAWYSFVSIMKMA